MLVGGGGLQGRLSQRRQQEEGPAWASASQHPHRPEGKSCPAGGARGAGLQEEVSRPAWDEGPAWSVGREQGEGQLGGTAGRGRRGTGGPVKAWTQLGQ